MRAFFAALVVFALLATPAVGADKVPEDLLGVYTKMDSEPEQLVADVKAGKLDSEDALGKKLKPILELQANAFDTLYPKLWGCKFGEVTKLLATADEDFDAEIAD